MTITKDDNLESFKSSVYRIVSEIPIGKVMSYGQIAALCGRPRAARIVGGIAHYGDQNLPWHRVVHKDGSLAVGYPGGIDNHKKHLEAEGIRVGKDNKINILELSRQPDKLVVVLGPTASGKTDLAIRLAKHFGGEIICADSRTVYKYMDIGTAKPTPKQQKAVKHHLLDIIEPSERFTVADFKQKANQAIREITSRGNLPIMVGGSGLYIDSVVYDYKFSKPDSKRDPANPRHLKKVPGSDKPKKLRSNTLMIGLKIDLEGHKVRISNRVDNMISDGLTREVDNLIKRFPDNLPALQAPAYKAFIGQVRGSTSISEAKELFIKYDRELTKKQLTWFKRNKSIHWISHPSKSIDLITTFLNKTSA